MIIITAQIEISAANPAQNFEKIRASVARAKEMGAQVVIFPELAVCGAFTADKLDEDDFVADCEYYNQQIADLADGSISIIFGSVASFKSVFCKEIILPTGRKAKCNAICIAQNGHLNYRIKTALSYDEQRHFALPQITGINFDAFTAEPVSIQGIKFGLTAGNSSLKLRRELSPMCEIIVNISLSPYYVGKKDEILQLVEDKALANNLPVIYCGGVGVENTGKNVYTFDGSSLVIDSQGDIVRQSPSFEEDLAKIEYNNGEIKAERGVTETPSQIAEIHQSIIYGIRIFMRQCGLQHVVIGASGGVDSTLAAALYAEAIGAENLLLVNMPTKYNSQTTIQIAQSLANNIGCWYTSVPIGESLALTQRQIDGLISKNAKGDELELKLAPINIENIQARDRGSRVLAAISSAWNGVFTNNGNKTECTVGYATLYGDVSGFFGAIGDLWKHQVYALCRYINEKSGREIVPQKVLEIVPSAELSDNQNVDQNLGDPIIYPYHDRLFASWRDRDTPLALHTALKLYTEGNLAAELNCGKPSELTEEFIRQHFPTAKEFCADLENWYRKYKGLSVAKRIQAPPILRITPNPYGSEYRENAVGAYFTKAYLDLKAQVAG